MTAILSIPDLHHDVPLAPLTTYQIGGPAQYFLEVTSAEALGHAVQAAREAKIPYFILGTGANILIRDGGIKGLVIHNRARHFRLDGNLLWAESGAAIADLIMASRDAGLSGLEHFVGIPSSVGGALRQNLHFLAPDRLSTVYIESVLNAACILDEGHQIHTVDRDYFHFGYDDSILHHTGVVVLDATFALTPKPKEVIQRQMDDNMAWRIAKQPQLPQSPSCGSVFKKIEGIGAGRLIDKAGLKGKRIGGAQVSDLHANYIVNVGGATAADVEALIAAVQREVKAKTGYVLECEIGIVGEK